MRLKILVLTLFSCLFTHGQSRYCDLKIEFTSPAPQTIVYSPGAINFEFKVVNQGPDSLYSGDTMLYSVKHGFMSQLPDLTYLGVGQIVPPNDSFYVSGTVGVNGDEDVNPFVLSFYDPPRCYGRHQTRPLKIEFWNDVTKDNFSSVNLIHKVSKVGIDTLTYNTENIAIYPNPTTGIVQVKGISAQSCRLINALGQDFGLLSIENETFDLSGYPTGLYFLEIDGQWLRLVRE